MACGTLALIAQDGIKVYYQGNGPTISDFARAFFEDYNEDECGDKPANAVRDAMSRQRQGLPLDDGETLIIDEKNGYIFFERDDESTNHRMEMCYWNEKGGKYKLFAFNNTSLVANGKLIVTETSGLMFYRYNNATKTMTYCKSPGFEVDYGCSYTLPQIGKDIIVTEWDETGPAIDKPLKWNGRGFSF